MLGIDTPIFTPTYYEDAFLNQVVLAGVEPTLADHAGQVRHTAWNPSPLARSLGRASPASAWLGLMSSMRLARATNSLMWPTAMRLRS